MFKNIQILITVPAAIVLITLAHNAAAQGELLNIPAWQQPIGKQYFMTAYTEVILNSENIGYNTGSMLSAWNGEEIVGVTNSYISPFTGYPTFFITLASDSYLINDLTFKIYNADTDIIYNIETKLDFEADSEIGTFYEPLFLFALSNMPNWQQPTGKLNIMTAYTEVILNGENIGYSSSSMLSAWNGREIVGVTNSYISPYTGYPTFYITMASNSYLIEGLTFKIYNADTDEIFDIETTMNFVANDERGSFYDPVFLTAIDPVPDWQQPTGKQNIVTVTAVVMLNGKAMGSNPESMLSTWDGEQITGVINSYINPVTGYPTFTVVAVSNKYRVNNMKFKLYDADTKKIYEIEETFNFVANTEIGNFFSPSIVTAINPVGSELQIAGDLDGNELVNDADLLIFCTQWMEQGTLEADIFPLEQGDGQVDLRDFAVFANAWLTSQSL